MRFLIDQKQRIWIDRFISIGRIGWVYNDTSTNHVSLDFEKKNRYGISMEST